MERFDERLVVNEDSGNRFYQVIPCEDGKFVLYADAQATVEALQAQLPAEMQECTILFKECEKGHGRLTATNWIDHGCQTCEVEALQREHLQLQALVRALPVVNVESLADYNHMLMTSPIDEPLKNLIRYRASLDATPPEERGQD